MTDDLTFEELPPGRYKGTVEKIRYIFKAATHIVITYKLDTPDGEVRRIVERLPIECSVLVGSLLPDGAGQGTGGRHPADQGPVARRRSGCRRDQGIAGPARGQCNLRRHPEPAGGRVQLSPSWTASKLARSTQTRGGAQERPEGHPASHNGTRRIRVSLEVGYP